MDFLDSSLSKTPPFVGRDAEVEKINRIFAESVAHPCAVFVLGEGGIGKSWFIKKCIDQKGTDSTFHPVRNPIDLYHTRNHTNYGLANALYSELRRENEPQLINLRNEADKERRIEDWLGLPGASNEGFKNKSNYISSLSEHVSLIIALDTVERIAYQIGTRTHSLEANEAWNWLVRFIPQIKRGTFLFAGRNPAGELAKSLEKDGIQVEIIELRGFTEEESIQYFESAADEMARAGQAERAKRIRDLDHQIRNKVHLLSGGRPITLALLADIATFVNPPLDLFRETLDEIRARVSSDPEDTQRRIEHDLMDRLIRLPVGRVLLALGRAQKGVDAKLLAKLLQPEGATTLEEAQTLLEEFEKLAISRGRIVDDFGDNSSTLRLFLHDEMYAMLKREVYQPPEDDENAYTAAEIIKDYYREEIENCLAEMELLYPSIAEGVQEDIPRFRRLHLRRRRLNVENVYYRLRSDLTDGFGFYYRYSRESTRNHDILLDYQLQFEMQEFLNELEESGQEPEKQNIARSQVLGVIALRPVVRAFMQEDYPQAVNEINRIRLEEKEIVDAGTPGTPAILDVWEAYNRIIRGEGEDLTIAGQRLDEALTQLNEWLPTLVKAGEAATVQLWRANAVLAFAYYVQGYYYSERYEFEKAQVPFNKASQLWRKLNVQGELALANNDWGYVQGELGEFGEAQQLVEDALSLRRRYGWPEMIGLSLNTLATVQLNHSEYEAASGNSQRALRLFELAPEGRRRRGLAHTTFAEALRRLGGSTLVSDRAKKIEFIQKAVDNAKAAVTLFEETGETSRLVSALIELGCAHRTRVKILYDLRSRQSPSGEINQLIQESEAALRRAGDLATNLYRKVDALINLAWLGFYAARGDLIEEATSRAKQAIPAAFFINEKTGKPDAPVDQSDRSFWKLLGKMHVLFGHRAFLEFRGVQFTPQKEAITSSLAEASREYTLGLYYSSLFNTYFRDLTRAKDEIFANLKTLRHEQLVIVSKSVAQTESEYYWTGSATRQFLNKRGLWYDE